MSTLGKLAISGLFIVASIGAAAAFEVTSPDIAPGGTMSNKQVFNGFGCKGDNISPALNWTHAPAGTKSFAIMMHDPDAPTGGAGWWHWVVVNIPATTMGLPAGTNGKGKGMPKGVTQVKTDFGMPGYGGPCPPQGDKPHHYNITVYALKVAKLDLPANATGSLAGYMINGNSLGKATLTGRYGR